MRSIYAEKEEWFWRPFVKFFWEMVEENDWAMIRIQDFNGMISYFLFIKIWKYFFWNKTSKSQKMFQRTRPTDVMFPIQEQIQSGRRLNSSKATGHPVSEKTCNKNYFCLKHRRFQTAASGFNNRTAAQKLNQTNFRRQRREKATEQIWSNSSDAASKSQRDVSNNWWNYSQQEGN